MIDLEFLQKLLDLLNRSEADTIEIRKWTTTIKVSKNSQRAVTYQMSAPQGGESDQQPAPRPATSADDATPDEAAGPEPAPDLKEIESPMVGTFYAQPEPGAPAYVHVGSRIEPGKTLCIIEAMKIMNPLVSEISGVVVETLVEDAHPVEFGQVLFRVNPNG